MAASIERHGLLEPSDHVLAAFSGGADSTCLALILIELGYRVTLGHVDHGLRGDSHLDTDHCRAVAKDLGVGFVTETVTVKRPTAADARDARYASLERMANEIGATKIATGHTLDDQAETVALRQLRGGFPLGMPRTRGKIVRPLLDLRRSETEQVCRIKGISFLNDPSNSAPGPRRNRVRSALKVAGDDVIVGKVRLGEASRVYADETNKQLAELASEALSVEEGLLRIERKHLSDSGPLPGRLIRMAVKRSTGEDPTEHLALDILAKVVPVTGASLSLPSGFKIWSEYDYVMIGRPRPARILPSTPIKIPGEITAKAWGLIVSTQILISPNRSEHPPSPSDKFFDAEAFGARRLVLRRPVPGDRFRPLRTQGRVKLQDFFVDRKVPRRLRNEVPVIADADRPERILWVVGPGSSSRIDERFQYRWGTSQGTALRVSIRKEIVR